VTTTATATTIAMIAAMMTPKMIQHLRDQFLGFLLEYSFFSYRGALREAAAALDARTAAYDGGASSN